MQCRYERVFCICRQCGCLGHLARDCLKSQVYVQGVIDEQKRILRQRFNVHTFCDVANALFIPGGVAFRGHNHCRTTRVFSRGHDEANNTYDTHNFHPS